MNKKASESITENIFRDYYGAKTFLEKASIPNEYGFESKKGTQKKGFPDFFLDLGLYAIVVEAKPSNHSLAEKEVQYYLLNNEIKSQKDLIGMAISGQSRNSFKVTYFCLLRDSDEIVKMKIEGMQQLSDVKKAYENFKNGDQISDEELTTILLGLNKDFHDNNVRDTDRSLFFSSIMIALKNTNFRSIYRGIQAPSDEERAKIKINLLDAHYMNRAILEAVETELKERINNLSKEFSWKDRFSFIKTIDIPLQKYISIIKTVETKIFIPFQNDEKLDILGRAYKIFLKRAGKVDNKNIILTPDHIKNLMVKLARLSKEDVILDTCTGSGGFLMQSMETMINQCNGNREEIDEITSNRLIGFEIDPILFSLACTNMFLHGDGRTNMLFRSSLLDMDNKQDKLVYDFIKDKKPTKIIINPPYERGNPIKFTNQAIDFLEPNGKLIIIMPSPTLTSNIDGLTRDILNKAKLDFVIKMPVSIFKEQDRTVHTSIFGFTKTPHMVNDEVVFYELKEDGLVSVQHKGRVDKYNKWDKIEADILNCILNKKEKQNICEKRTIYVNNRLVLGGVKKQTLSLSNLVKFSDLFITTEYGTLQSENNKPDGQYDFITAAEQWKCHDSYTHDCEAIVYAVGAEGSLGRAHYVNGKFVASNLCLILTPKDSINYPIDLKFYSYYLMAVRERIVSSLKNGTSKLTIKPEELGEYPIEYFEINKQIELKNELMKRQHRIASMESELNNMKISFYQDVSKM